MKKILVVDFGESIIGIQPVEYGQYVPYRDEKRIRALDRLESADEIITYNGNNYDLRKLDDLSILLRGKNFVISGIHTDMREIYWPNIWGANLQTTYERYCNVKREFPDTYEGSNRSDVFMTLALWRSWKESGGFSQ